MQAEERRATNRLVPILKSPRSLIFIVILVHSRCLIGAFAVTIR